MFLSPELLLTAYCQGVFPMADEDGDIYWYDPDPRAIIPLNRFHVSHSLKRKIRKADFEIRIDHGFSEVIQRCSAPAPDRETTWISPEIMEAYGKLHEMGFAHTVETWQDNVLIGGLYGVAINGLFAGESMFSSRRDASKIALVFLIDRLKARGYQLLDIQFLTDHLERFGAIEISRSEYQAKLDRALKVDTTFGY